MKKGKKLLPVILSIAMLFSSVSFGFAGVQENEAEPGKEKQTETSAADMNSLEDGFYSVEAEMDKGSMFKIVSGVLEKKGDRFSLAATASGDGFQAVYMGSVEDAKKAEDGNMDGIVGYATVEEGAYKGSHKFFPIEIKEFDKDLPIATKSMRSQKWFSHTVKIKTDHLYKLDITSLASAKEEAEKYVNLNCIMKSIIKKGNGIEKKGSLEYVIPFEDEKGTEIKTFGLITPDLNEFRYRWDFSNADEIFKSYSNPEKLKLNKRSNETKMFKATLNLYPGRAKVKDKSLDYAIKAGEATPIYSQEFTFTLEGAPAEAKVRLNVTDKKTGEEINNYTAKLTDGNGKEIAPVDGAFLVRSNTSYQLEVSKDGYVASPDEKIYKQEIKVSGDETLHISLYKEEDAIHKIPIKVQDKKGKELEGCTIKVTTGFEEAKEVLPEDGLYPFKDNTAYKILVTKEGYVPFEESQVYIEKNEPYVVTLEKVSTTFKFRPKVSGPEPSEVKIKIYYMKDGEKQFLEPDENGFFTIARDKDYIMEISAEGYKTVVREVPMPDESDTEYTPYYGLEKTSKKLLEEGIAETESFAQEVVSEGDEPGQYPAGTKAELEAAIEKAKAVLADEKSTDSDFDKETAALKKIRIDKKKAMHAEIHQVKIYAYLDNKEQLKEAVLDVSADTAGKYGFIKSATYLRKVTALDCVLAMQEHVYGEDFTRQSMKKYFYTDKYDKVIKQMFEVKTSGKAVTVLNGESVENADVWTMYVPDMSMLSLYIRDNNGEKPETLPEFKDMVSSKDANAVAMGRFVPEAQLICDTVEDDQMDPALKEKIEELEKDGYKAVNKSEVSLEGMGVVNNLKLKVDDMKDGDEFIVLHYNEGKVDVLTPEIDGDYVMVKPDSLSPFIVMQKRVEAVDPVEPVNPVDPVEPVDPSEPVGPVDPVDPSEPVGPVDPVDPSEPVGPVDPANPVDPGNTEKPTDSSTANTPEGAGANSSDESDKKDTEAEQTEKKGVATGDNSQLELLLIVIAAGAIGLSIVMRKKSYKK